MGAVGKWKRQCRQGGDDGEECQEWFVTDWNQQAWKWRLTRLSWDQACYMSRRWRHWWKTGGGAGGSSVKDAEIWDWWGWTGLDKRETVQIGWLRVSKKWSEWEICLGELLFRPKTRFENVLRGHAGNWCDRRCRGQEGIEIDALLWWSLMGTTHRRSDSQERHKSSKA